MEDNGGGEADRSTHSVEQNVFDLKDAVWQDKLDGFIEASNTQDEEKAQEG